MNEKRTTARAFHDADGVEDWRVLFLADETHAPHWWTLASPENHGVDIAAWPDFEDNDS
jgi:hypothetical protein